MRHAWAALFPQMQPLSLVHSHDIVGGMLAVVFVPSLRPAQAETVKAFDASSPGVADP